MRSAWRSLGACVIAAALVGCTRETTAADLRVQLAPDERAALDVLLSRAHVEPSSLPGRTSLLDFSWRQRSAYAKRTSSALEDEVDRRTPDPRNAIAVERGHVVALRLAGTPIDDLRLFAPLTHLVVLDVHDAAIERIEGLDGLAALDHLDLSRNRITRIGGLTNLAALHSLYLADNRIRRVEGLDRLGSLEVLNLGGNAIETIEGLSGLDHLKALSLDGNPVSRIEGLDGLPELVDLDLAYCNVEWLESLGTMRKLTYLNLWHNRVHSLVGIENATPALLYVGLGENPYAFDDAGNERLCARYCPGRLITFL